jgi:hypothetical protein
MVRARFSAGVRPLLLLAACLAGLALTGPTKTQGRGEDAEAVPGAGPATSSPIDLAELEKRLKTTGLDGEVHGVVGERRLYVFTYRRPGDFFAAVEFPLVPRAEGLKAVLPSLHRHDRVRIKGAFVHNRAPQKHIGVTGLQVLERWAGYAKIGANAYTAKVQDELRGRDQLVGRVHAVAGGGRILVVEYRDAVLPVFVEDPRLTASLYRGDKIRLDYEIRESPKRPTHLSPKGGAAQRVVVLDRIAAHHGRRVTVTGALVLFPRSPQIRFDVFAIQPDDPDKVPLQYTLVDSQNLGISDALRNKLAAVWKEHADSAVNGRNKLINRRVRLKAVGKVNVVSPAQANPQIVLDSADAISVSAAP